ncbi:MAG: tetratricopeptide repeat protein [Sedimentisphaerales bacterium]|nr:tetratricopeptide repeat protein [Sedimentisphaerales bacterium]
MDNILNKYRSFWVCLALTLATIAVYGQVCTYDFVNYDDQIYVYENTNIQSGITLKAVKWAFTTSQTGHWQPLTWLTLMADWQLHKSWAGGYHLTNLIFHIANTLLLFVVLKQMTHRIWPSAFVAALFALHPLHVESVAWVSERKDVLSTFFWILTMWAYVRFANRPKITSYFLVIAFFALGLMAKPMLVTLPFVLLLLDYWPLERLSPKQERAGSKHSLSSLLIEKVPLFAMTLASCTVTFIDQNKAGAVHTGGNYDLYIRLANASISYLQYIIKMIWLSHLAMFYPYPGKNISISDAEIAFILLLVVTIVVFRFAASHRYLVTGWFWYLGTLVPVIGFVQAGQQAYADRYSYIPLTGLFIIIAWGLPELLAKWQHYKIALWVSTLMMLSALALGTYNQQRYWKNSITLCEHALKVTDNNYEAHFCMAAMLLKQNRIDESIQHSIESLRITPINSRALNNLGVALYKTERTDEAIACYEKALEINPSYADANINLAVAFETKGDITEAVRRYRSVLETKDTILTHKNIGYTLMKLSRFEEAIAEYNKALLATPDDPDVLNELGYSLSQIGKFDEAIKCYTEVIRLTPNSFEAHCYLGGILIQKGRINEAITHFEDALRLKPVVELMNALGWLLAINKETTIRNPDKAVKLALQACELTHYEKPKFLDTLAVAYAAAGDFNKAIETAEKAVQLCKSPQEDVLKQEIENRLALYRAGKPYTEGQ